MRHVQTRAGGRPGFNPPKPDPSSLLLFLQALICGLALAGIVVGGTIIIGAL